MKIQNYSLFTIVSFVICGSLTLAETSYRVSSGATVKINEWDVCKRVVNNGTPGVYVPTKTAKEWQLFRDHLPAGVSLLSCGCTDSLGVTHDIGTTWDSGELTKLLSYESGFCANPGEWIGTLGGKMTCRPDLTISQTPGNDYCQCVTKPKTINADSCYDGCNCYGDGGKDQGHTTATANMLCADGGAQGRPLIIAEIATVQSKCSGRSADTYEANQHKVGHSIGDYHSCDQSSSGTTMRMTSLTCRYSH